MALRNRLALIALVIFGLGYTSLAQEAINTYKVKKRETLSSIAQKFGMDTDELLKYNPSFKGKEVQQKDILIIPSQESLKADREAATRRAQLTFSSHTVAPKETIYGIARRWGVSQDDLKKYNPELENSVPKIGMVIKIPVYAGEVPPAKPEEKSIVTQLETPSTDISQKPQQKEHIGASQINAKRPLKVDIMLPFYLNYTDSLAFASPKVRLERPKIALSFYMGARMALDSLNSQGLKATVRVFDTQRDTLIIKNIINKNDFSDTDLIIGPLYNEVADYLASSITSDKAIIVSPLSVKHRADSQPNILQASPSLSDMQNSVLGYLTKTISPSTDIIILASATRQADIIEQAKRSLSQTVSYDRIKIINTDLGENTSRLAASLSNSHPAVVIVPLMNSSFISEVIQGVKEAARISPIDVVSFEIDSKAKGMINSVEPLLRDKLRFVYSDRGAEDKRSVEFAEFAQMFKAKYGEDPNNYSVIGFDITYELLMALAMDKNTEHALTSTPLKGVGSVYSFKKFANGGYFNSAAIVITNKPSEGERIVNP